MKFLLDTHVLLQWQEEESSLPPAYGEIFEAAREGEPLGISEITLWEIAMLYERGRVAFDVPLRDWLERASAAPLVARVAISPEVAAEVAAFPSTFHRDPADRIIVATARVLGATLLTRDQRIIGSGLVTTA